jgi:predicted Fe-S protein YdhL (DUF1289 family)
MNESSAPPTCVSRCIGVCTLNGSGVCVGCHRDVAEISAWANASPQEREKINRIAALRERQMNRRPA